MPGQEWQHLKLVLGQPVLSMLHQPLPILAKMHALPLSITCPTSSPRCCLTTCSEIFKWLIAHLKRSGCKQRGHLSLFSCLVLPWHHRCFLLIHRGYDSAKHMPPPPPPPRPYTHSLYIASEVRAAKADAMHSECAAWLEFCEHYFHFFSL